MAKEFTKIQNLKIKKLIRKSCANYFDENCCLLDDGYGCPCIQIISCHFMCNYFKNTVLPLEPSLEKELTGFTSRELCALCKKPISITGNKKKYCKSCARMRKQIQKAEYQRKYRKKVEK